MWEVSLFTSNSGKSPVRDFLFQLQFDQRGKTSNVIELLKEFGPSLREPHSKKISGYKNLFELRTSGKSSIRLFYTKYDRGFIILHAFKKKGNKTPIGEISTAIKRVLVLT